MIGNAQVPHEFPPLPPVSLLRRAVALGPAAQGLALHEPFMPHFIELARQAADPQDGEEANVPNF